MKKQIWKFPIGQGLVGTVVRIPWGYRIVYVDIQRSTVCVWAEVNPEHSAVEVEFEIIGTGHEINRDVNIDKVYIGSVKDDPFMWHVYQVNRLTDG